MYVTASQVGHGPRIANGSDAAVADSAARGLAALQCRRWPREATWRWYMAAGAVSDVHYSGEWRLPNLMVAMPSGTLAIPQTVLLPARVAYGVLSGM